MLQDIINRYLGSRTRPRPQNFSVGVIFDAKKNGRKIFQCGDKFSNVKRKIVGFIIEYRKMKLKELKCHESSLEVIDVVERSPFSIRML